TVVVKQQMVLAVEAVEGTDAAIERGGRLAQRGCIVVKVSKPQQDLRFDVPAVGVDTVARLSAVGGAVLAVEAGKTILLEKEELLKQADAAGSAVVGVGYLGKFHAEKYAASSKAELLAVADIDAARAAEIGAAVGAAAVTD